MKKAYIANSYYVNNYGTLLQAFALQRALRKAEIDSYILCIDPVRKNIDHKRNNYLIKASFTSRIGLEKIGIFLSRVIKRTGIGSYSVNSKKRDRIFRKFRKDHLVFSETINSVRELTSLCEEADAVIVGSDQLWLPANIAGDYFTLSFVPDRVKKISYATSFGQSSLPGNIKEKAAGFLKRMDHLSVREASGARIIYDLVGLKAETVLDPVFLLDKEEWASFMGDEPLVNGDYILCYFLGKSRYAREYAKKLGRKTGWKTVALPHLDEYIRADENYPDIKEYEISPFGFINLIANARFILTDSFHCTSLAMIFRKDFYTFRRYPFDTSCSTNDRLYNILDLLSMKDRMINTEHGTEKCKAIPCDYGDLEDKLSEMVKRSYDYLVSAAGE